MTDVTDESVGRLHPLLSDRLSPRSFDPSHEVDDATLLTLLEAARWAPSSMKKNTSAKSRIVPSRLATASR